jgi:hypothetical protein
MIVTEKFIFIHLPKTGGTFVETCLQEVYQKRYKSWFGKWSKWTGKSIHKRVVCDEKMFEGNIMYGQHQGVEQINFKTELPIVSILREPYDWYASLYNFAWWKRNLHSKAHQYAGKNIASYPELNFTECIEFYGLCGEYTSGFTVDYKIGYYSWYFISLYFKNPISVLKKINKDYILSNEYLKDMHDVKFIWQGDLNLELFQMLNNFDYSNDEIDFVKDRKRVLPTGIGRKLKDNLVNEISELDKEKIREMDLLIFHFIENNLSKFKLLQL